MFFAAYVLMPFVLKATTWTPNVECFNPITGTTTIGGTITGGSTKSFTGAFSGDAVLCRACLALVLLAKNLYFLC